MIIKEDIKLTKDNFVSTVTRFDVFTVPTNGFIARDGYVPMGRGIAKLVSELFPDTPKILANKIRTGGNVVHFLFKVENTHIVSFPSKPAFCYAATNKKNILSKARKRFKPGERVPGFLCKSDIDIIRSSLAHFKLYLTKQNFLYPSILFPLPGTGNGELLFSDVLPLVKLYIGDLDITIPIPKIVYQYPK